MYLEVEPETIAKIEQVARALGRSKAATLDLILQNTEVDSAGKPAFWHGPVASEDVLFGKAG